MTGKTILLTDDNPNARETLGDLLKDLGYNVVFAASGEEAVAKAKTEKLDLIVLDTEMTGIDGIEACRQIKQVEKIITKVIVYTGKIDAVDAVKAREAGADDYAVKSANPALLLETIKKLI